MRNYETVMILKPELEGDALDIASREAFDLIKKHKGEIEAVDAWGKKALSFKIRKQKKGAFFLVRFKADPSNIKKIKREFTLDENILRALVSVRN